MLRNRFFDQCNIYLHLANLLRDENSLKDDINEMENGFNYYPHSTFQSNINPKKDKLKKIQSEIKALFKFNLLPDSIPKQFSLLYPKDAQLIKEYLQNSVYDAYAKTHQLD